MCIDFDGHHSGGSSFDLVFLFFYKVWAIPTGASWLLKKIIKKNQVKSPSYGLASPKSVRIRRSGRTRNRGVTWGAPIDIHHEGTPKLSNIPLGGMHQSASVLMAYGIEEMFPLGGMH